MSYDEVKNTKDCGKFGTDSRMCRNCQRFNPASYENMFSANKQEKKARK